MEVLHDLESLRSLPGPVYLAIGIFDGVHRGHRALIEEAQADAKKTGGTAVVMTFEPHPMMFFQRSEPPLRLSSPGHKELLLERQGVTHLAVLPFEAGRAGQTAEEFVEDLRAACRPLGGVVVGVDWKFARATRGGCGPCSNYVVNGPAAGNVRGQRRWRFSRARYRVSGSYGRKASPFHRDISRGQDRDSGAERLR